jgi:heme oxygenase (mycobilin-producing)
LSFVVINAIAVPEERRDTFEERFAGSGGHVSSAPGFEAYELMRPHSGDQYYVYTRWRSRDDFDAWKTSESFGQSHRGHDGPPAGTASELLEFDVLLSVYGE